MSPMTNAVLYLVLLTAAMGASFALLGLLLRAFTGQLAQDMRARRRAWGLDLPVERVHRPVEAVAADLRRLARQVDVVPAGSPQVRRRGFQAAYDDVLCEAAGQFAIPTTLAGLPPGFARDVERLRIETALSDLGLVVR
jgi:hypothetical protein